MSATTSSYTKISKELDRQIEEMAAETGKKKADVIRDLRKGSRAR